MAVLLLPVVSFTTKQNQQRFLSLLKKVAEDAWQREPECLGYCWLTPESPADVRVRGFEMYSDEEALTVTHRAGSAYQTFKEALTNERLAPGPSSDDLKVWHPVDWASWLGSNELSMVNGKNGLLSFLVAKYTLKDLQSRTALLRTLKRDLDGRQSEWPMRIVATAEDCHDVVRIEIWTTSKSPSHVEIQRLEESRARELGGSVAFDIWKSSSVKCDSKRPRCGPCRTLDENCVYGDDRRQNPRASRDSIATVVSKLEALESVLKGLDRRFVANHDGSDQTQSDQSTTTVIQSSGRALSENVNIAAPLASPQEEQYTVRLERESCSRRTDAVVSHTQRAREDDDIEAVRSQGDSISPQVTNFMVDDEGSISAHGPSSAYHYQEESPRHVATSRHDSLAGHELVRSSSPNHETIRLQLVAHAALERQKESAALLQGKFDFDGVDSDTALHLLQIHWNRHHQMFLLTYRPLVMQNVAEDGPYANKLLWNAVFYASALHSARPHIIRSSPGHESLKDRFYRRFKLLLSDALEQSAVPTIAALLLMGSSLVSSGSQAAGWNYCGLAYRMIIDLGMHLDSHKTQTSQPLSSQKTIKFTEAELEMHRRIFYGAYIVDKFQSLYFGRPPALPMIGTEPPQIFLDTYEEFELWYPYSDSLSPAAESRPFVARPSYVVSTFQALLKLAEITNDIIAKFYMPSASRMTRDGATACLKNLRKSLDDWLAALPECLHFQPPQDPTPPPHQVTLHTTFHTLKILVHRPFLPEGHLNPVSIEGVSFSETCLVSARQICTLAKAYEEAFSLGHAPYLFSYALFSAATVVTRHESDREMMTYLWKALTRIQRGANFGLLKPLRIIRDLMERVGVDVRTMSTAAQHLSQLQPKEGGVAEATLNLDENAFNGSSIGNLDPNWLEDLNSWQTPWEDSMQWLHNSAYMEDSRMLYGLFESGD
ncbi:uncharacterized protein Z518_07408 [Rhinocladiella mackenziei CBS 650.93]|uniref:Xylanolytic transcriptional activator regulatory domain-containing protein n=1 Tax=Rhinocladiella mackenziei CBS 650.93 TaxID=1442369 RepID=A0A0D2J4B2_9EURO|nr:uncharacterized protein Z518_07408 [Rhinocladiella mackenziei CBS 650.93]KIX03855.1 hypothetical protein Z518_07408 [Rhinocladiella mackenziei CBS 650.93]